MDRPRPSLVLAAAGLVFVLLLMALTPAARASPVDIYLYGADPEGWGRYPATANLTHPGPYLTYANGTQLRLILESVDGATHRWFIDYSNNSARDTNEPRTGSFSGGGVVFYMTLAREGNFTYRCQYHPTTMWGYINIVPAGSSPPSGPGPFAGINLDWNLLIFAGIMAALTIGVIVVFRSIWHSGGSRGDDEDLESPRGRPPRSPR